LGERKLINGIETAIFRESDNYKEYYTADADGIRLHGFSLANGRTAIFDPPIMLTRGVIEFDDTVITAGVVRIASGHGRIVEVPYSASMLVSKIDDMIVPAGTFDTVRVGGPLNISGETPGMLWFFLAPGIGVVESSTAAAGEINTLQLVRTNVAPFTINASSLPEGEQGVAYKSSLGISPPGFPYTVNVVTGSLPAGLTIDNTGALTGVPTAEATSTKFTVDVSENGSYVTRSFSIRIHKTLKIVNAGFKAAAAGKTYAKTLKGSGGKGPYAWSLVSGSLPPGLALNSATGSITGVPTQPGTFSATFAVADTLGGSFQKTFSLTVK
jgi:hypothetical protein